MVLPRTLDAYLVIKGGRHGNVKKMNNKIIVKVASVDSTEYHESEIVQRFELCKNLYQKCRQKFRLPPSMHYFRHL